MNDKVLKYVAIIIFGVIVYNHYKKYEATLPVTEKTNKKKK